MEVHAHTHTERKKFTHYLWEFLMLFLAVFCGFLAENFREHQVEHQREKQFMISLTKDLQLDTAQFSKIINYRLNKLQTIDSLALFFVNHPQLQVPAHGYTLAMNLFGHAGFFQNSGTLDELKNSGGLRLIRHRNIVDSIESYDQQIKRISLRDIYETNFSFEHHTILLRLFDGRSLSKIFSDTIYNHNTAWPNTLVKLNEQYIGEYLNSLRTFKTLVRQDLNLQAAVKTKATLLITLIKKEYHLSEGTPLEK